MDQPIAMSLPNYKEHTVNIGDILTISFNDIYYLCYINSSATGKPTKPWQKEDSFDGNSTTPIITQVKTDLVKGSKILIKVHITFNMYMIDQCEWYRTSIHTQIINDSHI